LVLYLIEMLRCVAGSIVTDASALKCHFVFKVNVCFVLCCCSWHLVSGLHHGRNDSRQRDVSWNGSYLFTNWSFIIIMGPTKEPCAFGFFPSLEKICFPKMLLDFLKY